MCSPKKSSKKHDEVQISPVAGDFCRSCLLKETGTGCNWLDEMKWNRQFPLVHLRCNWHGEGSLLSFSFFVWGRGEIAARSELMRGREGLNFSLSSSFRKDPVWTNEIEAYLFHHKKCFAGPCQERMSRGLGTGRYYNLKSSILLVLLSDMIRFLLHQRRLGRVSRSWYVNK